ncbi:rho GTPase-activating protein 32-like [Gallus gallus]|uniref:rho GTPase-activating protein 32-like n=1 Tax=Gallus gallus TaxID=9031 RepID=UPI001EFFBFAD|nr:rho GTPase-activating protein 32-like [Gallus gallus]XP_046791898.1 rho GTPase-activating protein 32-like [Gallus gallus]
MPAKNLAIVWAPNLFRSQQNESACASGRAACMELQRQSDVVEYIISHTDVLFCSTSTAGIGDGAGRSSPSGPKSVRVSSPATMLLSVEEAQAQRRGHSSPPALTRSTNIEVEEGPAAAGGKFHTVIAFPSERPSPPSRVKESPACSWCSCFSYELALQSISSPVSITIQLRQVELTLSNARQYCLVWCLAAIYL